MTLFYNRDAWNSAIGFGVVAALLCALAVAIGPRVVAAIFAGIIALLAALLVRQRFIRWSDLRQKGYFGGRRVLDTWLYEERDGAEVRSLALEMSNTEPGHHELFLPSPSAWRTSVPGWAQDRQPEIVQRIAERLKSRDIHAHDASYGISREEVLAQMERDGWTRQHRPDGKTLMIPPPRRTLIRRFWRRIHGHQKR
jgi:hypothetical protein